MKRNAIEQLMEALGGIPANAIPGRSDGSKTLIFACGKCGRVHMHAGIDTSRFGSLGALKCTTEEKQKDDAPSGAALLSEEVMATMAMSVKGDEFTDEMLAGILEVAGGNETSVAKSVMSWIMKFGEQDARDFIINTDIEQAKYYDARYFFKGVRLACKERRDVDLALHGFDSSKEESS